MDLTFKEQFQVAKPTDRYKQLLDCLPDVYVAPEAAVTPLVNFLCQEIACAFRANGTVLPPWRHVSRALRMGIRRGCQGWCLRTCTTGHEQLWRAWHGSKLMIFPSAQTAADTTCFRCSSPPLGELHAIQVDAPQVAG